jgi:hypothetical protein
MSIYSEPVLLSSILPINVGLSSATEETMISLLGRPHMPLTTDDHPDRASDLVKALKITDTVAHFHVSGIRPAVRSLQLIFQSISEKEPALAAAIGYAGMLVVRLRRPTSGKPSKKISNHSWGTAIDFNIDGGEAPGDTGTHISRGIAELVPYFNKAG